ncbi:MAG TPA: hypothetical protein PK380_07740 [Deltaproteobacteria bacterium]|nr:hypothetical protein [Deltaproteobacteria bacterium]
MAQNLNKLAGTSGLVGVCKFKRIQKSGCTLNERTDLVVELFHLLWAKYREDRDVAPRLEEVGGHIRRLRNTYEPKLDMQIRGFRKKAAYTVVLDECERILSEVIEDENTLGNQTIGTTLLDRPGA